MDLLIECRILLSACSFKYLFIVLFFFCRSFFNIECFFTYLIWLFVYIDMYNTIFFLLDINSLVKIPCESQKNKAKKIRVKL